MVALNLLLTAAGAEPARVAVLDFKAENATNGSDDWTVGLADFVELTLQKEGVPTLERRQIRLILGERDLRTRGLLTAETLHAAKLPTVTHFVSGQVRFESSNEFVLTLSLVRAENATVNGTWTQRGSYPAAWLPAIESLSRAAGVRLQSALPKPASRSEFEALTWLPEAALPFFKGLEYYGRSDMATAIPWFRNAIGRDQHFALARKWEARAYRQLGFPELARAAATAGTNIMNLAGGSPVLRPVVTVVAANEIPLAGRSAFQQALAHSEQFEVFEPAAIGATTREIDLQLTGQMAAPMNERSVWLVVDSLIYLDVVDGKFRARQQRLLSGDVERQVAIPAMEPLSENSGGALAAAFLNTKKAAPDTTVTNNGPDVAAPRIPGPGDTSEVAFAKVLRLAKAQPDQARHWISLADRYGDWDSRTWLLDQAVAAIDRNRTQADASFFLASALWRLRTMQRNAWMYSRESEYRENPLTNDFARLLHWFPDSADAQLALAEISRKAGMYAYSHPKDHRYLIGDVYALTPELRRRNWMSSPAEVAEAAAAAAIAVPAATDAQRKDKLNQFLREGRTALAWQVVNTLRTPDTASVRPEFRTVYDKLEAEILRENTAFKAFTQAVAQKQSQRALELGRSLLDCSLRQQRLEVIRQCGVLLKEVKSFPEQFEFIFTQARRYRSDFLLDPVTGAPGENISYKIEGSPPNLTRWTTYGTAYEYAVVMGDLANAARGQQRPDLAGRVFAALRNDETLPLRNRLTAACDLAMTEYDQGRHFEALEILKEVLQQTQGTGMSVARSGSWEGSIESLAIDGLRKIRLYTSADVDVCGSCGTIPAVKPPIPANLDALNQELAALWQQTVGGVGANNRPVKEQLLDRKDVLLPVILYKLQNDQEVSHMLLFCGELGTNAVVALPWIIQSVCHADRFEDYNNALSALGRMGPTAACAKPLLILALEDSRSVFNAKFAIKKVGPAPRQAMPVLAQLLRQKNTAVSEQAARAMIETAKLDQGAFQGKTGEPLILGLRQWWEENGIKQDWKD